MPKLSKNIGYLLILLGLVSYFGTGMESLTALIPTLFGLGFLGLGIFAGKSEYIKKHAMHAALLLALIGLIGSFGGLPEVLRALGGASVDRLAASVSQSVMAVLCIYFLIMGVKSFINARQQPAPVDEKNIDDTP